MTWTEIKRQDNKRIEGYSMNKSKTILIDQLGLKCNKCKQTFNKKIQLQLDHVIPVSLKGEHNNIKNHQLLCHNCHMQKTIIDKKIVKMMKECNVLIGKQPIWETCLGNDEFIEFSTKLRSMLEKGNKAIKELQGV